jgi:hypothetical protein
MHVLPDAMPEPVVARAALTREAQGSDSRFDWALERPPSPSATRPAQAVAPIMVPASPALLAVVVSAAGRCLDPEAAERNLVPASGHHPVKDDPHR